MGILDKVKGFVLGLKDIDVSGNMHVGSLRDEFKKNFGTELRVYKTLGRGANRADPKQTLASICDKKVEGLTIKKSDTVGDIENQFKNKMGIGIQIMQPNGEDFAPNSTRLKDVAEMK